uniref:Ig-like domain-containing protein n=1 Tax=Denticeps clupeoides TaxID=299321 RepID=A0AAY4AFT8_9TELE
MLVQLFDLISVLMSEFTVSLQIYTVTLRCNITQYTDWEYYWYRDNSHISSKTSKTITISLPTESGQYVCSGRRRTRPLNSSSNLPTPALTVDPQSPVFTGEKVTLKCEVEPSSGWRYKWYKEQSSNVVFQSEGNTFIITAVSGSDEGRYWCRGEREHSNSNTPTSRDVYLVYCVSTDLPKAKVTIVTPQRPFYKGDRVTLRCNITQYTDWEYYWYRDNTHIPSWVEFQSSGKPLVWFHCHRLHDPRTSTVTDLPKATVTVESPEEPFYPGDTVTLRCDITQYTDWEYYWYRDNSHIPSKTSKTITISLPTESGQYVCSGRRGTRPQYSYSSQAVTFSYQGKYIKYYTFIVQLTHDIVLLSFTHTTSNLNQTGYD